MANIAMSQTSSIMLQRITIKEGLSQSHVNTIYQDSRGFVWFGTSDGLNRYDGHEIKIYKYDPDGENTISDNFIRTIIEDNDERLWIGTDAGGLNVLDLKTDSFQRISLLNTGDRQHQSKQVWDMSIDNQENLWIATWEGLFKIDLSEDHTIAHPYSKQNKQIRCVSTKDDSTLWVGTEDQGLFQVLDNAFRQHLPQSQLKKERIYTLLPGAENEIWIGSREGFLKYNTLDQSLLKIPLPALIEPLEVSALVRDKNNNLWVGTIDDGLFYYNTLSGAINTYLPGNQDDYGSVDSGILDIHLGQDGILWIATRGDGIQFFDTQAPFKYYGYQPDNIDYLSGPSIRSILTDDEKLWVGGYNGLNCFIKGREGIAHYGYNPEGLTNNNIYSLLKDSYGRLWVGTEGGGLFYLDAIKDNFVRVPIDHQDKEGADHIFEIYQAADASIYFGTGAGLYQLKNPGKDTHTPLKVNMGDRGLHALDAEDIIAITQNKEGLLYVGTGSAGLYALDSNNNLLSHYIHSVADKNSISNNRIKSLHVDQKGFLWVGTNGGGLNKLDTTQNKFYHYSENDGLSDNTVYGILEDGQGRLWLSTNKGISLFNESDNRFKTFGIEHGLQSLEFNTSAFHKSESGEMFFGGINGLNAFYPEAVITRSLRLQVIFTDFKVLNRSVAVGSPLLPLDLNSMSELSLTHKERLISFEFSGMNFLSPTNTRYRYMIPGVDDSWVYTEPGSHSATYTDLSAGSQELLVQAAQSTSDYFGEMKRLMIKIKPAPWDSLWARATYVAFAVLLLLLMRQNEIKKIRLKEELKKKKQEAYKLNEIDEMKSRLISNVSYELRTPLTLLEGQFENLNQSTKGSLSAKAQKSLKAAQSSLYRVNELSDQLFSLAGFTSGKIKLQTKKEKLSSLLSRIVNDYSDQCQVAGLNIAFIDNGLDVEVYLDKNKFEQILINLLSNAIKYSDKGSTINVELIDDQRQDERGTGQFAVIGVDNQGIGIPESALPNLFDRLYEIDATDSEEKAGTGIGLALVKELVELHGGTISVESIEGGKTRFEFMIPKGTDHLAGDEIMEDDFHPEELLSQNTRAVIDPTQVKILVVEDEESMRSFLYEGLGEEYQVIIAEDGQEGFSMAVDEHPDLIIADIHMPHKSGLDMLKDIRSNKSLMNIPVIILTGQTSSDDRVVAYKAAANDFISKPFKLEELKVRIENIISQRNQLISSFKKEGFDFTLPETQISKINDRFYVKLKGVIEENIDHSDLTVDVLAKEMFLSKRQLERRLKELTGQSPADLIRQTRLLKAKMYLMEGSYATVAEVSFAVGFKNVKYFSRLFKNQFNQSPADILHP